MSLKQYSIYHKLLIGVGLSVLTYVFTLLSSGFSLQAGQLSPFWPVSGIGLAIVLALGPRYLIFPALGIYFWYLQIFGFDWAIAFIVASLSIIGSAIGGLLFSKQLLRVRNMKWSGLISVYVFGLVIVSLSSILWVLATKSIGFFAEFATVVVWLNFLMSESLGALLFFPLIYLALCSSKISLSAMRFSSATLMTIVLLAGLFSISYFLEGILATAALIFTIPTMALYALNERSTLQFLCVCVLWSLLCLACSGAVELYPKIAQPVVFLEEMTLMVAVSIITFQLIHFTNIERILVNQHLAFNSTHDKKTGLLNERGFNQALLNTQSGLSYLSAMVTLSHSDELFENLGYEQFNTLIKEIASRIESPFATMPSTAIINGSKVAVLVPIASIYQGEQTLGALHDALQNSRLSKAAGVFIPEVSLGGITFKSSAPKDLLTQLSATVHYASQQVVVRYYLRKKNDTVLEQQRASYKEFEYYKDLLGQGKLQLWGQIISPLLDSQLPIKVELLARLSDADNQLISPLAFISSFEKYQYHSEFDKVVVIQAFSLIKQYLPQKIVFNINITADFFADLGFTDFFLTQLKQQQIPAFNVAVEITESQAIPDIHRTRSNIITLQEAGVEVGLDDFGTGFAGYSYLLSLPFNFIKLDGEFIKDLPRDPKMQSFVSAMAQISKSLNTLTVAEYVQDQETVDLLIELGIHYGQGFGLSKPQPLDTVIKTIASGLEKSITSD